MTTLATTLHIGPADNGRALTLEEFLEAEVEEGYRYELARGVLEVSNVPNDPHWQVVSNLYTSIGFYRQTHADVVRTFGGGAEFQFLLPRMVSGRHPDLAVVLAAPPVIGDAGLSRYWLRKSSRRAASVAIMKRKSRGISRLWLARVLDSRPAQASGHRARLRRGDAWHEVVLRDQQVITSQVLPGFAATVAELWTDVEDDEDSVESDAAANGS